MNRNELNKKLTKLRNDYNKSMQDITNKSIQRERNKLNELTNNINGMDIKTSKTEQKPNIPEEKTENKELKDIWEKWDYYRTYFPNSKYIWKNNFPQWFRDLMNEIESR